MTVKLSSVLIGRKMVLLSYFMIYRCKEGELTAKFSLDRDENGLTAQYYSNQ